MSPVILWRRLGLTLIARASCGPEAALLGHASSLLCAAWGKHRVLLEQLRVRVVLCKITPGSRQGRGLNEPRVHAHRDRARLRALLFASVPFSARGLSTVMCRCAGMLSW